MPVEPTLRAQNESVRGKEAPIGDIVGALVGALGATVGAGVAPATVGAIVGALVGGVGAAVGELVQSEPPQHRLGHVTRQQLATGVKLASEHHSGYPFDCASPLSWGHDVMKAAYAAISGTLLAAAFAHTVSSMHAASMPRSSARATRLTALRRHGIMMMVADGKLW